MVGSVISSSSSVRLSRKEHHRGAGPSDWERKGTFYQDNFSIELQTQLGTVTHRSVVGEHLGILSGQEKETCSREVAECIDV